MGNDDTSPSGDALFELFAKVDKLEQTTLCCHGFKINDEDYGSLVNSSVMFAGTDSEANEDDSVEGSVVSTEHLMNEKTTLFWCTYNAMKDYHGDLGTKAPLHECCSQHCTNMYHLDCIKMHLEWDRGNMMPCVTQVLKKFKTISHPVCVGRLHADFDDSCQTQESNVGTQKVLTQVLEASQVTWFCIY
eukprot:15356488-Ditylum_brightwellii.AAC.1